MSKQTTGKKFFSTTEVADLLHVSRTTVFKMIKSGQIKAEKIGRNYIVPSAGLANILGGKLDEASKKKISRTVDRVISEYGETIKLLGND